MTSKIRHWARVVVYRGRCGRVRLRALEQARHADLIVKASGVGVFDELLEAAVLNARATRTIGCVLGCGRARHAGPRTERTQRSVSRLIPRYDYIFTYGGGEPVIRRTIPSARAGACRFTTRSIHRRTTPLPPTRDSRATRAFWETAYRIAKRASKNSFSGAAARLPETLPAGRQWLGTINK